MKYYYKPEPSRFSGPQRIYPFHDFEIVEKRDLPKCLKLTLWNGYEMFVDPVEFDKGNGELKGLKLCDQRGSDMIALPKQDGGIFYGMKRDIFSIVPVNNGCNVEFVRESMMTIMSTRLPVQDVHELIKRVDNYDKR